MKYEFAGLFIQVLSDGISNDYSVAMANSYRRVLAGGAAFGLRRIRLCQRLVVIALFMRGNRLEVVVCSSNMAGCGEMVFVACHFGFGVSHDFSFG
jgi:hypothetical protein